MGQGSLGRSGRGEKERDRWRKEELRRRRFRRSRARGRTAVDQEERRKPPAKPSGRGLYAPAAGSPDALNVAPDASGDHRTHAQRGLHFDIAPDDGHRTLALASGASGHAR